MICYHFISPFKIDEYIAQVWWKAYENGINIDRKKIKEIVENIATKRNK